MSGNSTSSKGVTITPIGLTPARIAGYDVARATAFLGMVFVNYKYQDRGGSIWC